MMDAADDRTFVDAIRGGSEESFSALFRAKYADLKRFAHSILNDSDRADDVVQEVFAGIWANHQAWSPTLPLAAYLFRAVRNRAIDRFRQDSVVARMAGSVGLGRGGADLFQPDQLAEGNDIESRLVRAIRTLPERQRTAILLRWHHDLNSPAIAEVMGISPVAARKLLGKAEEKLKASILA